MPGKEVVWMWIQCMDPLEQLVNLEHCKVITIKSHPDGRVMVVADDMIISTHRTVQEAATVRDALAKALNARSYQDYFIQAGDSAS